jgi:hypothetical protein
MPDVSCDFIHVLTQRNTCTVVIYYIIVIPPPHTHTHIHLKLRTSVYFEEHEFAQK